MLSGQLNIDHFKSLKLNKGNLDQVGGHRDSTLHIAGGNENPN